MKRLLKYGVLGWLAYEVITFLVFGVPALIIWSRSQ